MSEQRSTSDDPVASGGHGRVPTGLKYRPLTRVHCLTGPHTARDGSSLNGEPLRRRGLVFVTIKLVLKLCGKNPKLETRIN